jgi:hypothetical protein
MTVTLEIFELVPLNQSIMKIRMLSVRLDGTVTSKVRVVPVDVLSTTIPDASRVGAAISPHIKRKAPTL